MATRYEAYWVPGLDDDVDPDEALLVAFDWLRDAENRFGVAGVLAMNAVSMRSNSPVLESAPWDIVSRQSRRPHGSGPVLAVWPVASTLELAEHLALRTALCVVPGTLFDISPWARRTDATCVIAGFNIAPTDALPPDVREHLDRMLGYDGRNGFVGAGGKEYAIRTLRELSRRADAPTSSALEEYLAGSGKMSAKGAARAAKWYEEIRGGKRHLDYARRPI